MAYAQSDLTKLRRSAKRGSYDKEVVSSILDAALVAHVAARRHQKRGDSRTPGLCGGWEATQQPHDVWS